MLKIILMTNVKFFHLIGLLLTFPFLWGQADTVRFRNPGFEGEAQRGSSRDFYLKDWNDCGDRYFRRESPPDVHPNGIWQVTKPPAEGKTYVGLVTRDNGTYEIISTKLKSRLLAGNEYEFEVYLAMSEYYISRTHMSKLTANYYYPAVLKVFGATGKCKKEELLFETQPIDNTEWKKYKIRIKPSKDYKTLTFAACFKRGTIMPYNGHLLMDGLSPIQKITRSSDNQIIR